MTTLGKIEEFDVRGGKIDRYLERFRAIFCGQMIFLLTARLPADNARF